MPSSTYVGSGVRTFIPQLARLCCRIAIFIAKHQTKINANLDSSGQACLVQLIAAVACLCKYKNISSV